MLTPIQHLERLYSVLRKMNLSADDHDELKKSAEAVARALAAAEKQPDSDATPA